MTLEPFDARAHRVVFKLSADEQTLMIVFPNDTYELWTLADDAPHDGSLELLRYEGRYYLAPPRLEFES